MTKGKPPDKDKKEYLEEHFFYEAGMLLYSFGQLRKGKNMDQGFTNMALETFLLHARNLREFFYMNKKFPDDARAHEFFADEASWRKLRPEETDSIKKVKERADKELAHLTYNRYAGTPPEKYWNYSQILSDFLKVIDTFLDGIPETFCGTNLRDLKTEVNRNLQIRKGGEPINL